MTLEEMKAKAIVEMDKYVKALEELVDSRMMSLADGELAAYSKLELLSKEKAFEYRECLNELGRKGR